VCRDVNELGDQSLACFLVRTPEAISCIGERNLPEARVEVGESAETVGVDLDFFTLGLGAEVFKGLCERNHFHVHAREELQFY
jgi:hypothetical protein